MATLLLVWWRAGLVNSSWPRPQPISATYQTITIKCRGNDGSAAAAAALGAAEERKHLCLYGEALGFPASTQQHLKIRRLSFCKTEVANSSAAFISVQFRIFSSPFLLCFVLLPGWNNQTIALSLSMCRIAGCCTGKWHCTPPTQKRPYGRR